MTAVLHPRLDTRWTHWYRRALPAYWIFLVCITHFPRLQLTGEIPASDKLAHFMAFALLAFLLWRFGEAAGHALTGGFVWVAAGVIAVYAALDEYTQGFVGRGTDVLDWLCDLGGALPVLVLLEWRRRRRTQR